MIIVILEKNYTGAAQAASHKIQKERGLAYPICVDFHDSLDRGPIDRKINSLKNDIIPIYNTPGGPTTDLRLKHAMICTGDPIMVQLLNYELLKNPALHLEAYEAIPATKTKPLGMRSALKNGLIDESILQHAIGKFQKNYKKLLNKRAGKRK